MAIYHFSVKNISRSDGRSVVAAAAYRSGEKLIDERQNKEQDYTKKTGVEFKKIYAPEQTNPELLNRNHLWNTVEKVENRKNSQLAREFEIAFPHELNQEQREQMLNELCQAIVQRHNVVVDAAIHAPHTKSGSDERNYHAHILLTTRSIDEQGNLGKKTREFNDNGKQEVQHWREQFADLCNRHLEKIGSSERVDHRSYRKQESPLEPTVHEGSKVTQLRRKGIDTEIILQNNAIKQRNAEKLEQLIHGLDQEIIIPQADPRAELNQLEQEYSLVKARFEEIEKLIEDLEQNEPPKKKFGLFTNQDHVVWKQNLEALREEYQEKMESSDILLKQVMNHPIYKQETKEIIDKAKENLERKQDIDLTADWSDKKKVVYESYKMVLEQKYSGSELEIRLQQLENKLSVTPDEKLPNLEVKRQPEIEIKNKDRDAYDKGR